MPKYSVSVQSIAMSRMVLLTPITIYFSKRLIARSEGIDVFYHESGRHLVSLNFWLCLYRIVVFPGSSVVEQIPVKDKVVGSIPTPGARYQKHPERGVF